MKCELAKYNGLTFFILTSSCDGETFTLMKNADNPNRMKLDNRFLKNPLLFPLTLPMIELVGIVENLKLDTKGALKCWIK